MNIYNNSKQRLKAIFAHQYNNAEASDMFDRERNQITNCDVQTLEYYTAKKDLKKKTCYTEESRRHCAE